MFILLNLKLYVVFLAGEDLRQMKQGPILGFSTDKSMYTLFTNTEKHCIKVRWTVLCYIQIGIEH
jgi:hypothetical protein